MENFLVEKDTSYRCFEFLKRLQLEINILIEKEGLSNSNICVMLLQLNYNSRHFFQFYTKFLLENSQSSKSIPALTEYYYLQLKIINQLPQLSGTGYSTGKSIIKEQVATWLAEEIYFLEKKQHLEYFFTSTKSDQATSYHKLHTNLSVAHLSLAVKLLIDTGIIKHNNTTELMRMVAKNFRTEKSEHISEDSLRNKAYNIETTAVKGMQDVIVSLLNEIRKY